MPSLLVFGGTGFVGSRLLTVGAQRGFTLAATYHSTTPGAGPPHTRTALGNDVAWSHCDLSDQRSIDARLFEARPDVVVNAAYVKDGPTSDVVCGIASGWIAEAAERHDARFVHVSTDLVFDGTLGRSYGEDDATNPLSAYGTAKLLGEQRILDASTNAAIARTSIIYGHSSAPQETLTKKALNSNEIAFFTNEWRSPIHVEDLAIALLDLAGSKAAGIIHVAGAERVDRLTFATMLAEHEGHDSDELIGRLQDASIGPRPEDVSLDISRAVALGLHLPGVSHRLTS